MINPYKEILLTLTDAKVDFIVGGGVACVLHGVERVTMDVDLAVMMTPSNFRRFLDVMHNLKLKPRVSVDPAVLLDPTAVKMLLEEKHALVFTFLDPDLPLRQIDLFLKPELGYDALFPHVETVTVEGRSILLIGKRQLLALKQGIQPPRAKDLLDIETLRKLLNE